jgi:tetratricopeptide (TPR) repeat protein
VRRALATFAVLLVGAGGTIGCGTTDGVVRVVDDRPIVGPFVPSEAYAAYLRAAIAESSGDLAGAVEGYSIAVALGPSDPEPWTRLGDARCARDSHDAKADDAIAHALAIDASYAPAWEARARCAEKRGDARGAMASANRAMQEDPSATSPLATLAEADRAPSPELRARLVAMTLASGTDAAAWRALATWARGHGDAPLQARALGHVAALEPARGAEIDAQVVRFVRAGKLGEARSLARARVTSAQHGVVDPLVARFAIDDALLVNDAPSARRMATIGRVPLVVVAARALLLGDAAVARRIADEIVAADPRAVGARLVLAAAGVALQDEALVTRALAANGARDDASIPPEVWLVYARVVAREGSTDAARALLLALKREAILRADPVTTPLAAALAARGVLDAGDVVAR